MSYERVLELFAQGGEPGVLRVCPMCLVELNDASHDRTIPVDCCKILDELTTK